MRRWKLIKSKTTVVEKPINSLFNFGVVFAVNADDELKCYYLETVVQSVGLKDARRDFEAMMRVDGYFKNFVIEVKQVRLYAAKVERKQKVKNYEDYEKDDNKE